MTNTPKPLPDAALLREYLNYDPETGELTWKKRPPRSNIEPGTLVGRRANSKGYYQIIFRGKEYRQHRIIWKMVTGEDPGAFLLDHKDGNFLNNRWSNLRLATPLQNAANSRHPAGRSGLKNVLLRRRGGVWRVRMTYKGKRVNLGSYRCKAKAEDMARFARELFYGDYATEEFHTLKPPWWGWGI